MAKLAKKNNPSNKKEDGMDYFQDLVYVNTGEVRETVITETIYQAIPKNVLKNYFPAVYRELLG